MTQTAIRCSVLRGGTSKGLYFQAEDLPADRAVRDAVLLAAMGSPDDRGIDGMGGGHPLTSKVAVVRRSDRDDADVDYLFLQVWPDRAEVSDNQNCGNLLAGVGPFAIESGLVAADSDQTDVRVWMENTSSLAVAHLEAPAGAVRYDGNARIDGVPGTSAPIPIDSLDVAGSSYGALLPTGNAVDEIDGVRVTCIDNGMPVVCMAAADFGVTGHESPAELEANTELGVFRVVSVATACLVPGSVAAGIAALPAAGGAVELDVEHPTGFFTVSMDVDVADGKVAVHRAALLRTARLLMRGDVFLPASVWDGS
jgi:4-oxalomesaconate tautomerase